MTQQTKTTIYEPVKATTLLDNLKKILLTAERHVNKPKGTVTTHNAWSKILIEASLALQEVSRLLKIPLPTATQELIADCLAATHRISTYHSLSSAGGVTPPVRASTIAEQQYSIYKADYAQLAIDSALALAKIYAVQQEDAP